MSVLVEQWTIQQIDLLVYEVVIFAILLVVISFGPRYPEFLRIRRVPAIDAVEDAIRACTETGRPCLYAPGYVGPTDARSAAYLMGSLAVLKKIARMCAELNVRLIRTTTNAVARMMISDFAEQAYIEAGYHERFVETDTIFVGGRMTGLYERGIVERANVGGVIHLGAHGFSSDVPMLEASKQKGAFIVSGQIWPDGFIRGSVIADYVAITEEVVAAGAYLSKDPIDSSALVGEDIVKLLFLGIVILGILMRVIGRPIF